MIFSPKRFIHPKSFCQNWQFPCSSALEDCRPSALRPHGMSSQGSSQMGPHLEVVLVINPSGAVPRNRRARCRTWSSLRQRGRSGSVLTVEQRRSERDRPQLERYHLCKSIMGSMVSCVQRSSISLRTKRRKQTSGIPHGLHSCNRGLAPRRGPPLRQAVTRSRFEPAFRDF